jgi:hypothetical protein
VKFVSFLLACAICAAVVGCARKPAYSNINVNATRGGGPTQASADQSANAAAPAADPAAESSAARPDLPPSAQPPPQESARPTEIKMPAFFDAQTGEVMDLPSYPKSQRISIQYGPIGGEGDMASLVLAAPGSMDSIAAFYDKAIKSNGWELTVRNRDPEFSEWKVKKGDKDEGRVTVRKDPAKGGLTIQIVRTAKPVEKK